VGTSLFHLALGLGMCGFAISGLVTGELYVGRNPPELISYADDPAFLVFALLMTLALGVGLAWHGYRQWPRDR
jgi:hypothetical protein